MSGGEDTGIAIIGLAGRFPGARDVDEFWANIVAGVECITFFSDDELRESGVPETSIANPDYVKAAPVTEDAEMFDAGYFGMSPREAEILDPQHRVFLEECDTALQNAGYDAATYPGRVGVYGGTGLNTYLEDNVNRHPEVVALMGQLSTNIANTADYLATGTSYRLNLRGPSLTCLTACSTSMTAIHLASQALRNGDCEMALAGGVEEFVPRVSGYFYSEGGLYSPDGHCRTFDAKARGTVFGSGAGVVVLKRLDAALADGDTVLAVIRATALNNDGADKGAFTAPSIDGQVGAITQALQRSGVDASTISYVEAHGTSTYVGDPIEVNALTRAFRQHTDRTQYCGIGSVKTNVGHLGAAAGVTGVIKTVLAMRHRVLPPTINFDEPNPQIDFPASPFYVNTELTPWKSESGPLRASVSSFGVGGTNGHLVLEESPQTAPSSSPRRRHQLVLLSARTPTGLQANAVAVGAHLRERPEDLADAAWTLAVGRTARPVRGFLVATDGTDAAERLAAGVPQPGPGVVPPRGVTRPVTFAFPGQGAQYPGMGRELYDDEPVFAECVDACAEVLREHVGWDVREVLYPGDQDGGTDDRIHRTEFTQPALFVVEYALARLVQSWGLAADAVVGHSIGEYVAATVAGVFDWRDALRLVADRGRLMQELPGGSMLAVPLPEHVLAPMLPADLDVAAVNAPDLTVVSGTDQAIEGFAATLRFQGIEGRVLLTSHAFHSAMVEPVLGRFEELVAGVPRRAPETPVLSNLTGAWLTDEQAVDPAYWSAHLRSAVRFSDAAQVLCDAGQVVLELGPGQTLTGLVRRQLPADKQGLAVPAMRHPQQRQSDTAVLLSAVGQVWQTGARLDVPALWSGETRHRIPLPRVPFEKQRLWLDGRRTAGTGVEQAGDTGDGETGPYYVPVWKETALPTPGPVDTDAVWVVLEPTGTAAVGELTHRLRAAGARVVAVRAGAEQGVDGDTCTVRPREVADYSAVLTAALADGAPRLKVVHGWLAGELEGATAMGRARDGLDRGFFSILAAAQAVSSNAAAPPTDFYLLTSDMQDVVGTETVEPVKNAVEGFVRLLPKEFSATTCRSVDVPTGAGAACVEQLLREVTSDAAEPMVAYRGRKRWTWSHQQVDLTRPAADAPTLRDGGVYVITGGLGGIGLVMARELAERHQAKLVLLGRNGLPPREHWAEVLDGPDTVQSTRIRAVQEMESLGGEVLVVAADVTDVEQLAAVRREAEAAFGPVDGVLHAAGITGGGMVETRSPDDAEDVLAPKVFGTLAVDEVFGDDVDLVVCYSTFAVFTGDYGLFDYCAANAVMDSWARSRSGGRAHVVTINWPIWAKVGMAADIDLPDMLASFEQGHRYEKVAHPLLGSRLLGAGGDEIVFVKTLTTADWVADEHRLLGRPTLPGTSLVEMVRAAYQEVTGADTALVRDIVFAQPVSFDERRTVHLVMTPGPAGVYDVAVVDPADGARLTTGRVGPGPRDTAPHHDLDAWRAVCHHEDEAESPQEDIITLGRRWADAIKAHWHGDRSDDGLFDELVLVELDEAFLDDLSDFGLHPALLDKANALGQTIVARQNSHVPFGYDQITVRAPLPRRFYSYIKHVDDTSGALIRSDIVLAGEDGAELVAIKGFTMFEFADESMSTASLDAAVLPPAAESSAADPHTSQKLERAMLRTQQVDFGIDPVDGYPMLREVLDSGVAPQVIVCPDSFVKRMRMAAKVTRDALEEQMKAAPKASSSVAVRSLITPYAEPENDIQRVVAEMWADTLGLDRVGVDDDFFDLNGNSLIAVQLVARIREQFQVDLTVAGLFETRVPRALSARIEDLVVQLLVGMSDEDAAARLRAIAVRT
ncbi:type I polyketide synthase [Modestobacter sp. Leaf380]|uniref:type I polyketide synthase n=1 Tax=Modestobacter sp. Leaf380 TaxID=1736356 RepID=UPI0006F22838|nr:type I polyketide synthase [Modestobacter sp. Leaf380]KQS63654.1 hypothetical protein ASG41_18630 [Modestobacter sp. Leaf380]